MKKNPEIKDEYLIHTDEVFEKMNAITQPVATYIFDGTIKDVSEDGRGATLVSCMNGETKKVKLPDQLMIVEQYILAKGDEAKKNIWREIDLKELFSKENNHLSHLLKKETDEVLVIRKIILMYR